jgi:hypothetical protein
MGPPRQATYAAAREAAGRVRPHFVRHAAASRGGGSLYAALLPDAEVMESIMDAAFWASLRKHEGHAPQISLAFVPREHAGSALVFERAIPLTPDALTWLAPAVERPGIHLGVWKRGDGLLVWGTTRTIPVLCFVLEVVAPGVLVVKHRRGEDSGKFVNIAVLEGDQIKVVDTSAALESCPSVLCSMLWQDTPPSSGVSTNVLIELAVSMRAHRRGGALLVAPAGSDGWRESIISPLAYSVSPPFEELAALVRRQPGEMRERQWQDELHRAVEAIAGLTAVDGATVINDSYDLLAFGAKIRRRRGSPQVERLILTEPVEGSTAAILEPGQIGGTRHISAAQFVHDQRDSMALVASQDGRFTIFAWSPTEEMVHAHRVEALLV